MSTIDLHATSIIGLFNNYYCVYNNSLNTQTLQ